MTTETDIGTVASTTTGRTTRRLIQAGVAVAVLAGLLILLCPWRSPAVSGTEGPVRMAGPT